MPISFPNTEYTKDSVAEPRPNASIDLASDGTPRGRRIYGNEVYDFVLINDDLTEAEADAIENAYEADPLDRVDVVWRGVTYYCYWKTKPLISYIGAAKWLAESRLIGNRADGA